MIGISTWLAAVKDLKLKENFTGSKIPQWNAVVEKKKRRKRRRRRKRKKKKRSIRGRKESTNRQIK
jgi:hypothetical protein